MDSPDDKYSKQQQPSSSGFSSSTSSTLPLTISPKQSTSTSSKFGRPQQSSYNDQQPQQYFPRPPPRGAPGGGGGPIHPRVSAHVFGRSNSSASSVSNVSGSGDVHRNNQHGQQLTITPANSDFTADKASWDDWDNELSPMKLNGVSGGGGGDGDNIIQR